MRLTFGWGYLSRSRCRNYCGYIRPEHCATLVFWFHFTAVRGCQNIFALFFFPRVVSTAALRDMRGKEELARGVEAVLWTWITLTSVIDSWKFRDGEHSVKWSKKKWLLVCMCLFNGLNMEGCGRWSTTAGFCTFSPNDQPQTVAAMRYYMIMLCYSSRPEAKMHCEYIIFLW